jgi:hypothetical protein
VQLLEDGEHAEIQRDITEARLKSGSSSQYASPDLGSRLTVLGLHV